MAVTKESKPLSVAARQFAPDHHMSHLEVSESGYQMAWEGADLLYTIGHTGVVTTGKSIGRG